MRVNLAHYRAPGFSGAPIDFAVFDAKATSGGDSAKAAVLAQLTSAARRALNLKIDQSALAFMENGRLSLWGSTPLIQHLSQNGVPPWTHFIDV